MIEQFASLPNTLGLPGVISPPGKLSSPSRNWKSIAQTARAARGLRDGLKITRDLISRLEDFSFDTIHNPHPFKIYNVPYLCLASPDPDTDWLTYRVRAGQVGDIVVDGTDDVEDPYGYEIPLDTGNIVADPGEELYFFWLELSAPGGANTATVKYGSDPNSSGWDDYPLTDGRFILIGWIDTTDTVNKQVKTRQILNSDVPQGIDTVDCSSGGDSPVSYDGHRFTAPS